MKKNLAVAILAASYMLGTVPVSLCAQSPMLEEIRTPDKETVEKPEAGLLRRVKERWTQKLDAKVDRLKRCLKGQCTKLEVLKAALDVVIVAGATMATLYITGGVAKKGGSALSRRGYKGGGSMLTRMGKLFRAPAKNARTAAAAPFLFLAARMQARAEYSTDTRVILQQFSGKGALVGLYPDHIRKGFEGTVIGHSGKYGAGEFEPMVRIRWDNDKEELLATRKVTRLEKKA